MITALFCYGTLQDEDVMRRVIGEAPRSQPAQLRHFRRAALQGLDYPGIRPEAGAIVEGMVCWGLTQAQIRMLDQFEGHLYRRQIARVELLSAPGSGRRVDRRVFGKADSQKAWVYVLAEAHAELMSDQPWSLGEFQKRFRRRLLVGRGLAGEEVRIV
jgi:gamma-glutamylcyclotransferase (GGCT)/AIG2-like uncharacterized protein YtfP